MKINCKKKGWEIFENSAVRKKGCVVFSLFIACSEYFRDKRIRFALFDKQIEQKYFQAENSIKEILCLPFTRVSPIVK